MKRHLFAIVALAIGCPAVADVIPDFDYKLTPWKTRADEWRGAPRQTTSVTNWTEYDRLAADVVNFDVGGEAMCVFLKSAKPQTGLVQFRTRSRSPSATSRTTRRCCRPGATGWPSASRRRAGADRGCVGPKFPLLGIDVFPNF